jgi:cobalamin biosynthesis protein CobD/CbiB
MVGSLLGVAWTMASFLVVPVLVMQNVGPIDAIKRSVELLKRTWGENAIGNVGIGLVFGLVTVLLVVVAAVLVFLAASVSGALAVTVAVFAVLALVTLGIIQSALSGVYSAALYRYATVGEAPAGFSGTGLQTAFQPR